MVTIDLTALTVTCQFIDQHSVTTKSCSIEYGPSNVCSIHTLPFRQQSNQTTLSTVVVDLVTYPVHARLDAQKYCFVVTADNGTHNTQLEGSFFIGTHFHELLLVNLYSFCTLAQLL